MQIENQGGKDLEEIIEVIESKDDMRSHLGYNDNLDEIKNKNIEGHLYKVDSIGAKIGMGRDGSKEKNPKLINLKRNDHNAESKDEYYRKSHEQPPRENNDFKYPVGSKGILPNNEACANRGMMNNKDDKKQLSLNKIKCIRREISFEERISRLNGNDNNSKYFQILNKKSQKKCPKVPNNNIVKACTGGEVKMNERTDQHINIRNCDDKNVLKSSSQQVAGVSVLDKQPQPFENNLKRDNFLSKESTDPEARHIPGDSNYNAFANMGSKTIDKISCSDQQIPIDRSINMAIKPINNFQQKNVGYYGQGPSFSDIHIKKVINIG